jgi:hypothetical protein
VQKQETTLIVVSVKHAGDGSVNMELNEKTKDFLQFDRKIMESRDGKKRVIVNNKLEEIKYKNLKYKDA